MAALLKQDYAKVLKAGAELVMISPDSLEQHRPYSLTRFGAKLPCLYVSDSAREIAPRYGLPRVEEHYHGGFYYRSLGYFRNYSRSSAANRENGEPSVHDLSPGLSSGKNAHQEARSANERMQQRARIALADRSL